MATSNKKSSLTNKNSSRTKNDNSESLSRFAHLECTLCLEVFRNPKFLDCHHSFCEKCLEDVATKYQGSPLPCPVCRKETVLPPGGVKALQANFHVVPDELDRERGRRRRCAKHQDKELEVVCVECQLLPLCVLCVPDHSSQNHHIQDIRLALPLAISQLAQDKSQVIKRMRHVKEKVTLAKTKQQAVLEKRKVVEDDIKKRHALLVAEADKYRDMALKSLDKVMGDIQTEQGLQRMRTDLSDMNRLRQQIEQAQQEELPFPVLDAYREARHKADNETAPQDPDTDTTVIERPVLHFSSLTCAFFAGMKDFLGCARKLKMASSAPEGSLKELFHCPLGPTTTDNTDLEVFSIRQMPDVHFCVSFEPNPRLGELPLCKFSATGALLCKYDEYKGRVTTSHGVRISVTDIVTQCHQSKPGHNITYAKGSSWTLGTHNSTLGNSLFSNKRDGSPQQRKGFTVRLRAHRTFDTNLTQELFAVVKEKGDGERKVRLYRQPDSSAVSKYTPPATPWRPADVCFYELGGEEVLLVADELNDAIHVVEVRQMSGGVLSWNKQRYELIFSRYLLPGHPLLLQPTALNVDSNGCLLVACRGGKILLFEPSRRR